MRRFSIKSILLSLLVVSSLALVFHPPAVVRGQILPFVGVWSDTYSSSNVTDASLGLGSTLTFEVNVTDAPNFNGYEFTLFYDPGFLKAQSIDFTTGTVFSAPFVARNDLGSAGIVAVSVVNLGSIFSGGSGTLLHLKFLVTGVGVSPLTLAAGIGSPSTGAQSWTRLVMGLQPIDVVTSDGYFKNEGSPLGPESSFTFDPISPLLGETVIFDGSSSFDHDNDTGPNGGLASYGWDFGDGFSTTTTFPVMSHRFGMFQPPPGYAGKFSVRLTVTDSNDMFEAMIVHTVDVSTVLPSTADFDVSTTPDSVSFLPGGRLSASAFFQSVGGFKGNVAVTARVIPSIANGPFVSVSPSSVSVPIGLSAVSTVSVVTTISTIPGSYDVIVTGSNGLLSRSSIISLSVVKTSVFPTISVRSSFTSGSSTPLKIDSTGNPSVDVVLAHGVVRSTNPGQIFAQVNVTNTGTVTFSSLHVTQRLPVDWVLSPQTSQSNARIHVYFQFENGTLLEITGQVSITLSGLNPQTIDLVIPDLTKSLAGKPLNQGESILLSAKLEYGLVGKVLSPGTFPLTYTSEAQATAWMQVSFTGIKASASSSASFNANAKLMGDVNGDHEVDIVDLALVGYFFGSKLGSPTWNSAADIDNNRRIDIQDLAIVGFSFGDSY